MLGEPSRNGSLRLFSDALRMPSFCDRAACKRAGKCRGNAQRCLSLYAGRVPLEAREFIVDLMVSRELGYSFEEAMRRNGEGAKDFAAWVSPVPAQGNADAKAQ